MPSTSSSAPAGGPAVGAAVLGRWADSVWRGNGFAAPAQPAWPTGHPALDAELPGGGWPAQGLTELLLAAPGAGEWRLLAPALQGVQRPLLCIAPPLQPHAPALQALGLPLQHMVWVTPSDPADAAWAAEQALRSAACGAVLWWADAGVTLPSLRRLHLAAREHGCPLFALRPETARAHSSPAPLRLACSPLAGDRLGVAVFKRRGPAQARPLHLALPPLPRHLPAVEPRHAVARAAPALAAA